MPELMLRDRTDCDYSQQFNEMLGSVDARPRLVIDRSRRVLWASSTAQALMHEPVPLRLTGGILVAESPAATMRLDEFVEQIDGVCNSLLFRSQSHRHWAMMIGWSLPHHSDRICALVSLSVPYRGVRDSGLAAALKLTLSETRVLDEFARLNSPREIADSLGVSLNTVRSHLKQIHSKAGVASAVQLTQLVRGYCAC